MLRHRIATLLPLLLAAGCALPLQSALVDQPVTVVPATAAVAEGLPTVPAPATLDTALIASHWDEATGLTSILPVDPFTGSALEGYAPIELGQGYSSARSPDGRWLATLNYTDQACDAWAGGSRCLPSDGVAHFIELSAWRDTATTVRAASNATLLTFSADSRYLAIGQSLWPDHSLILVEVGTGEERARTDLDFYPAQAAFSLDGQRLLVYGRHYTESAGFNPTARVAALSAADLSLLWQTTLPEVLDGQYVSPEAKNVHDEAIWWTPGTAFDPAAQRLYVVHADADTLTTVDYAGQTTTSVTVGPAQSWLDRLMALTAKVAEAKMMNGVSKSAVLAGSGPDQRLYVVGEHVDMTSGPFTRAPLGLQVVDPATGVELRTLDTTAGQIALAPGGAHLLLTEWDTATRTTVLALADLDQVATLTDRDLFTTHLVNGQPALLALDVSPRAIAVSLLDPHAFTPLAEWTTPAYAWFLP